MLLSQNMIKRKKVKALCYPAVCELHIVWSPSSSSLQNSEHLCDCEILSFSQIADNSDSLSKELEKINVILEAQRRELINLHSTVFFFKELSCLIALILLDILCFRFSIITCRMSYTADCFQLKYVGTQIS